MDVVALGKRRPQPHGTVTRDADAAHLAVVTLTSIGTPFTFVRAQPSEKESYAMNCHRLASIALCSSLLSSTLVACKSKGTPAGGESKGTLADEKASGKSLKLIDPEEAKKIIGTFEKTDGEEPSRQWFRLEIRPDTLKCNHSNHTAEFTTHKYSLASAKDGVFILVTAEGHIKATLNGDSWKFDGEGECPWGLSGSYARTKAGEGEPVLGAYKTLSRPSGTKSAKLDEAVTLPLGTFTLKKGIVGKWTTKKDGKPDEITPVMALNLKVENKSESFIEFLLPTLLKEEFSGQAFEISCDGDEISGKGIGNPGFSDHKEPKFADGGGWGAVRASISPGKSRTGWLTLMLSAAPGKSCKLNVDTGALGGGVLSYELPL